MNERSEERLSLLRAALSRGGRLHLTDAADQCGVSAMTIRRDLAGGDTGLMLVGGLLMLADDPRHNTVYDLDVQQDQHADCKRRLCARALDMLEAGDTLFIDCGTTLMPLAASLPSNLSLTVVTYALNVADAVSALPGVRLWLLGGVYHASSRSFESADMQDAISRLGINKAFITAAGVHEAQGLSCFHFHEVAPKQAAIAAAQCRVLVADPSKHGRIRPARFAGMSDIDEMITEDSAPSL